MWIFALSALLIRFTLPLTMIPTGAQQCDPVQAPAFGTHLLLFLD
jgi:hypothetical protein